VSVGGNRQPAARTGRKVRAARAIKPEITSPCPAPHSSATRRGKYFGLDKAIRIVEKSVRAMNGKQRINEPTGVGVIRGDKIKKSVGQHWDRCHLRGRVSLWRQRVQMRIATVSPVSSWNCAASRNRYEPHAKHRTLNLRNGLSVGVCGGW